MFALQTSHLGEIKIRYFGNVFAQVLCSKQNFLKNHNPLHEKFKSILRKIKKFFFHENILVKTLYIIWH